MTDVNKQYASLVEYKEAPEKFLLREKKWHLMKVINKVNELHVELDRLYIKRHFH